MTAIQFAIATLIVAIGAVLQGTIGFGLAMFSAPILALVDRAFVPGPMIVAAGVLTLLMARREWTSVRLPDLGWSLAGRTAGTGLALVILTRIADPHAMDYLVGGLVLLGVLLSAVGLHLAPGRRSLMGAGLVSGLMGTTTSVGGPPMALLYQKESGPEMRGTLSAYFLAGVLMSLTGLAAAGRFGRAELGFGLALTPGILIGYSASHRLIGIVDRRGVRPFVLLVSGTSAAIVILRRLV